MFYLINKFKNKVFAIHLHDNFKINDDHNLPFDGTVDWNDAIYKIKIGEKYDLVLVIDDLPYVFAAKIWLATSTIKLTCGDT